MILQTPSSEDQNVIEQLLLQVHELAKVQPQAQVFQSTCQLIFDYLDKLPTPCFGLVSVLKIIERVNEARLLEGLLRFSNFEMWLNTHIDTPKNLHIRAKLSGRSIPRDEYSIFFPLSMSKKHWGSHLVTAHSSPDLDTAVASFWSWVDAFAARVGTGLHIWNLPGGQLSGQDARVFLESLGPAVFDILPQTRGFLILQAQDLLSPRQPLKLLADKLTSHIDSQWFDKGILLVDSKGYYLGDWRQSDAESVSQVISLLASLLRWLESQLQSYLTHLLAQADLKQDELEQSVKNLLASTLYQAQPSKEFNEHHLATLSSYLKNILQLDKGLQTSFEEFAQRAKSAGLSALDDAFKSLSGLNASLQLFDQQGHLIEDRAMIMAYLDSSFKIITGALDAFYQFNATLGVSMRIKHEVLGIKDPCASSKADVEEVRQLIGHLPYLTVVYQEAGAKLVPLGVIEAEFIKRRYLGTVSLRDFSNHDEVKVSSYLETISVIDHHKMDLKCANAPIAILSDVQSCNTLIAQLQMQINDRYSSGGQSLQTIHAQISQIQSKLELTKTDWHLLQRLFARSNALKSSESNNFFVDARREKMEYMFYLYAILDDTDLLAKSSLRDLQCVVELVNRIYSIEMASVVEILSLDDLPKDHTFIGAARSRILKHPAMYELYSKVYNFKEETLKEQIHLCCKRLPNTLFSDTKIQNGCARVGQIKLTSPLVPYFQGFAHDVRAIWLKEAIEISASNQQVDLFLQMISTIAGAKEVFEDKSAPYNHTDELWLWCPMHEEACEHLIHFLRGFRYARELEGIPLEVEVYAKDPQTAKNLIEQHFIAQSLKAVSSMQVSYGALVIFKVQATKLNSRKAVITPYLPSAAS